MGKGSNPKRKSAKRMHKNNYGSICREKNFSDGGESCKNTIVIKKNRGKYSSLSGKETVDEFDSLKNLKSNFHDLDEKMKFLKSQLKSIVGGDKFESYMSNGSMSDKCKTKEKNVTGCLTSYEKLANKCDINMLEFNSCNGDYNEPFEADKMPGGVVKKVDKYLDVESYLDMTDSQVIRTVELENNYCDTSVEILNEYTLKKNDNFSCSSKVSPKCTDISKMSDDKIERLLYHSFLLQNLGTYECSDEDTDVEVVEASKPETKKRNCGRKICQRQSKRPFYRRRQSYPRKKRSRVVYSDSSDLDVKNKSDVNNQESSLDYLTDEIETLDWNEPFELKLNESSDLEIIENNQHTNDIEIIKESSEIPRIFENTTNTSREVFPNDVEKTKTLSDYFKPEKKIEENGRKSIQSNEKNGRVWECPICFETATGQDVVTTVCGHIFCKACIENYLKGSSNCPTCRSNLIDKPLIMLYNF